MVQRKSIEEHSQGSKNSYDKGKAAEDLVRQYYEQLGFFFLGQRVQTPFFEVDLILENSDVIYLIEVKTISNWSRSQNRLSYSQKSRLLRAQLFFSAHFKKPVLCKLVLVARHQQIWSTDIYE